MKNEENQGFTSFDFITMMFSLAVIIAVSAPILKKKIQPDSSAQLALQQASVLGHDLVSSKALFNLADASKTGVEGRQIASFDAKDVMSQVDMKSLQEHLKAGESAGTVGQDPWGSPYNFVFLRNSAGMPTRVAVWSSGANKKSETSVKETDASSFNCAGDDVCAVTPIR